jgi:Arc/MetJ-type ribon-helix-helix transcriptional regulator
MSRTVTISDELAAMLEARRRREGFPSLDAAVEAFIAQALAADVGEDHSAGRSDDELRALIDEGEASGQAAAWDPSAVRAEVIRRHAARKREPE